MKNISVLGGQMEFKNMTSKQSEREYAIEKVNTWYGMLDGGMKPNKWLKANSKGTKVNFDYIKDNGQYNAGLDELETFIDITNKEHGTDFRLER